MNVLCNLKEGSPHLIVAYGKSDPLPGKDIGYHGLDSRDTKQVVLISGAINKEEDFGELETYDFMVENVTSLTLCLLIKIFLFWYLFFSFLIQGYSSILRYHILF